MVISYVFCQPVWSLMLILDVGEQNKAHFNDVKGSQRAKGANGQSKRANAKDNHRSGEITEANESNLI